MDEYFTLSFNSRERQELMAGRVPKSVIRELRVSKPEPPLRVIVENLDPSKAQKLRFITTQPIEIFGTAGANDAACFAIETTCKPDRALEVARYAEEDRVEREYIYAVERTLDGLRKNRRGTRAARREARHDAIDYIRELSESALAQLEVEIAAYCTTYGADRKPLLLL